MAQEGAAMLMRSPLVFGSVCSGIEAASCAWAPLGWRCAFVSDIDAFACALLSHRYPLVPNLGDMTTHKGWPDATLDVLAGGTPCQSYSVAGNRKGLDDERGGLMLTFAQLAHQYAARWIVWENVAGVLSVDNGRAFGALLGTLAKLGYGFAYRVFDAQFFGLAQRRNRVFVIGYPGDWRPPAAVLFERAGLQGHSAPRRTPREVTGALSSRTAGGGGLGTQFECNGGLIPAGTRGAATLGNLRGDGEIAGALTRGNARHIDHHTTLVPDVAGALTGRNERQDASVETFVIAPMAGDDGEALAFDCTAGGNTGFALGDVAGALRREGHTNGHAAVLQPATGVRRLTPRECERLQGFEDDYSLVPYRGALAADGPRYRALGNSMAVPVMRWIGERIAMVDTLLSGQ
jgi:DNA (cytosine-5)-methyltransferase 1